VTLSLIGQYYENTAIANLIWKKYTALGSDLEVVLFDRVDYSYIFGSRTHCTRILRKGFLPFYLQVFGKEAQTMMSQLVKSSNELDLQEKEKMINMLFPTGNTNNSAATVHQHNFPARVLLFIE
jgi:hypothetical protein